jgi:hypothetical protein
MAPRRYPTATTGPDSPPAPRRACLAGRKISSAVAHGRKRPRSIPITTSAPPTLCATTGPAGPAPARPALPPHTAAVARATAPAWETDGLRLLELRATADMFQILFSATPRVGPGLFCQRVKGRLQHALRQAATPVDFSRKVSFRNLGENTSEIVENYIRGQVGKEEVADSRSPWRFRTGWPAPSGAGRGRTGSTSERSANTIWMSSGGSRGGSDAHRVISRPRDARSRGAGWRPGDTRPRRQCRTLLWRPGELLASEALAKEAASPDARYRPVQQSIETPSGRLPLSQLDHPLVVAAAL